MPETSAPFQGTHPRAKGPDCHMVPGFSDALPVVVLTLKIAMVEGGTRTHDFEVLTQLRQL